MNAITNNDTTIPVPMYVHIIVDHLSGLGSNDVKFDVILTIFGSTSSTRDSSNRILK